jgi:hypothetical protein
VFTNPQRIGRLWAARGSEGLHRCVGGQIVHAAQSLR